MFISHNGKCGKLKEDSPGVLSVICCLSCLSSVSTITTININLYHIHFWYTNVYHVPVLGLVSLGGSPTLIVRL